MGFIERVFHRGGLDSLGKNAISPLEWSWQDGSFPRGMLKVPKPSSMDWSGSKSAVGCVHNKNTHGRRFACNKGIGGGFPINTARGRNESDADFFLTIIALGNTGAVSLGEGNRETIASAGDDPISAAPGHKYRNT
jgi:hypothetical protein